MTADDDAQTNALKRRLEALESEKRELLAELARLQHGVQTSGRPTKPSSAAPGVSAASDGATKIRLFRSLFRGRDDVFPRRWQNAKTGKSGYSPVCRNEWVRGICEKPRVKSGECPHQAFVSVTDDVVRCHLQGADRDAPSGQSGSDYIAGVYPLLAAATAFGKTVVASRVVAARARNTLVLVHRRQLMDQWVARLSAFLDIDAKSIGTIGGGKKRPTGQIDVALIQSLVRKGEVSDVVADYGQLIVDECHHLPAVSFEAVAQQSKAKYVLGPSATVTRKDGHGHRSHGELVQAIPRCSLAADS